MDRFKFNSQGIKLAIHNQKTGKEVILNINNPDRETLDHYERNAERFKLLDAELSERVKKSKKKGLRGAFFWGLIYPRKLKAFRKAVISFVGSMLVKPSKEAYEAISLMNEAEWIRLIQTILQLIQGKSLTYLDNISYEELAQITEKKTVG